MKKIFWAVALFLALVCVPTLHGQALFRLQNVNGGGGGTAFTFVNGGINTCAAATCSVTYSPVNGNLVNASYYCNNSTSAQNPTIITDTGTSTWAQAFLNPSDAGNYYEESDYTLASAGSSTVITAHCGAATAVMGILITEYHRPTGSWIFGGATSAAFGTSTTATGSAVTPTASAQALVLGYFFNKTSQAVWTTANTTIRENASDAVHTEGVGGGDQIVASATGTYSASANTTASIPWTAFTYWFK